MVPEAGLPGQFALSIAVKKRKINKKGLEEQNSYPALW